MLHTRRIEEAVKHLEFHSYLSLSHQLCIQSQMTSLSLDEAQGFGSGTQGSIDFGARPQREKNTREVIEFLGEPPVLALAFSRATRRFGCHRHVLTKATSPLSLSQTTASQHGPPLCKVMIEELISVLCVAGS